LTSLLGDPASVRVGCYACKMDTPSVVLDEEKNVEPVQEHGLHREEVAGQQGLGLGSEELSPARAHPPRRRLDLVTLQDLPDTRGRERYAHLDKLTLNPSVSPGRVLACEANDQRHSACGHPRPTRWSWIGPSSTHEFSVPSKQCPWLYEEPGSASCWKQPAQAGENRTIAGA
jgi:hypothetical protein